MDYEKWKTFIMEKKVLFSMKNDRVQSAATGGSIFKEQEKSQKVLSVSNFRGHFMNFPLYQMSKQRKSYFYNVHLQVNFGSNEFWDGAMFYGLCA